MDVEAWLLDRGGADCTGREVDGVEGGEVQREVEDGHVVDGL